MQQRHTTATRSESILNPLVQYATRVLSGEEGYLALVVWTSLAMVVTWFCLGIARDSWDFINLALALAWVSVAQVFVLAHIRRDARETVGEPPIPTSGILKRPARLAAITGLSLVAFALYVRPVSEAAISMTIAAILLWVAGTALVSWRVERTHFPWSATALGFVGAGLGVLRTVANGGPWEVIRMLCLLALIGAAFAIWLGLVMRDVLEIRASS